MKKTPHPHPGMPGWGTTKNFSFLGAVQHWYNGDPADCNVYIANDPGNGDEVLRYTFTELQFKRADLDTTKSIIEVWLQSVVVKTDYSKQAFLENIIGKDYASN